METKTEHPVHDKKEFLEISPGDGDAYYNLGIRLNEAGRLEEAVLCYQKAIQANPRDADAHYNMGVALQSLGKMQQAACCYANVISLNPNDAQAYNNMAIALKAQGMLNQAISCFQKAIELKPNYVQAYNNMGVALQANGNFTEALSCFSKVITLKPHDADALNNMGVAFKAQNKLDDALTCYQKAIEINPLHPQAIVNMGCVLHSKGRPHEAVTLFLEAIEINPDHAASHYNLANALKDLNQPDEAISHYEKAVGLDPTHSSAFFNMGNTYKENGKTDEAIISYQKAVKIDPGMSEAYSLLGHLLNEQGKTDEARMNYRKAIQIQPDPGLEVKSALLLPVICDSSRSITLHREKLLENLDHLLRKGIRIEDPLKEVGVVNFLSSYHGLNDRELQESIAKFHIRACPELTWSSPHCQSPHHSRRKISLGLISTFLYSHTIGHLFYGLIENLSREDFHITVFRFPGKEDNLSKAVDRSADQVVLLPRDLRPARLKISKCVLDVLFYLDLGMDPMTYFLAFSRLAPVQLKRGHPVTSGIPNVDYFLSPGLAESPGSDDHYSEHLIRLRTYGYYYFRPRITGPSRDREYFDLPKDRHLYVCPQSLFKFHPDYDLMFGKILKKDTSGLLVLLEGRHPQWAHMLQQRFSCSFPEAVDRVRFLPRMSHEDFMSLFTIADAVLDTPVFSGGKTSLDCLGLGIPVITLPGNFMRGRLTYAQYKQMGIMDCIAGTPEDFVNIAVRVANDRLWRDEIKNRIMSRNHVLFENMDSVREVESFIKRAVLKACSQDYDHMK